jgi:hypothetical protein
MKKGQLSAHSSYLCRVREGVRPLWVLCTQPFPAILLLGLEPMDLMVTRLPLFFNENEKVVLSLTSHYIITLDPAQSGATCTGLPFF